ncbi:MAG: hypothetical protein AUG44_20045 [Actinobacteria bacterium 13_1_20CM_3_71_11]|nr:MAG: hypothetical protein AUG44_20045 [Actinobacteria bacterium 13_1_20CM_3_71_11]
MHAAAEFVAAAHEVLASVPAKPDRDAAEQALAAEVLASCRTLREEFLRRHVTQVYDELTAGRSRLRRLDDLVYGAAEAYPWLVPDRATTETERANRQADKEGYECDQALFVAAVLDEPLLGEHLIRAMLRPTRDAVETLDYFRAHGQADLGCVRVDRRDGIGHVTVQNDRYLNAEDDAVIAALELAVDLVLLDDGCRVGVLRGGPVSHPRYRGKRVFSAGINLTHLYYGQISYIDFLMRRELGPMHKMYRGHWLGDRGAGGEWETREKPWIGAVDTFAIGGGLQMLLVTDRVVADNRAYFSLPALREGIVPGTGSLRINRFVGDRLARQLIFADRRIDADEPEARLLCDRIVEPAAMDGEIAAQAESLAGRAVIGNRRMARLAQEPVSLFRRYLAAYSREQMTLLYSDELVSKLEKGWLDRRRGG